MGRWWWHENHNHIQTALNRSDLNANKTSNSVNLVSFMSPYYRSISDRRHTDLKDLVEVLPTVGWRLPLPVPLPPRVTWCKSETLSPTTAVSPITTPVAWSIMIPLPSSAAGCMSTCNTSETLLWSAIAIVCKRYFYDSDLQYDLFKWQMSKTQYPL